MGLNDREFELFQRNNEHRLNRRAKVVDRPLHHDQADTNTEVGWMDPECGQIVQIR